VSPPRCGRHCCDHSSAATDLTSCSDARVATSRR
jgi:hypothetical protein